MEFKIFSLLLIKVRFMMCGDFNIDLLNKDCNNSTSFLITMYSLSLLPIISTQIRITDNSATLIDNFDINELCNFQSGILSPDISDHFSTFFNRKNFFSTNSSKNVNKSVHYRLVNLVKSVNYRLVNLVKSVHNRLVNLVNQID